MYECNAVGCTRPARGNSGYCKMHYTRLLRYGRLNNIVAEKGEGTYTNGNYKLLTINGKRVYEHTFIAEKALGKLLPKGAVIHHLNGNTRDNRPFNLVICPSQAYHLLLHRRTESKE